TDDHVRPSTRDRVVVPDHPGDLIRRERRCAADDPQGVVHVDRPGVDPGPATGAGSLDLAGELVGGPDVVIVDEPQPLTRCLGGSMVASGAYPLRSVVTQKPNPMIA